MKRGGGERGCTFLRNSMGLFAATNDDKAGALLCRIFEVFHEVLNLVRGQLDKSLSVQGRTKGQKGRRNGKPYLGGDRGLFAFLKHFGALDEMLHLLLISRRQVQLRHLLTLRRQHQIKRNKIE